MASEAKFDATLRPEPARAEDLGAALALLERSGLPTAGVADFFPEGYAVLQRSGELFGVAGLEQHGHVGLLRSVVVQPARRGQGLARQLIAGRLEAARARHLLAVYLLTTTAADYFRRLGFEDVPRQAAPEPLQRCAEFAHLCPGSAVCLEKKLV